ncbi:hypothetical protein Tco_0103889 [Tanacetum coccineum]
MNWLSNPVMVKRAMVVAGVRGTSLDLNKHVHKNCYPLPEIDWKVESLCGYPFKCFLDAYKGYHQIQMAKDDEEKTAFHTSQGVYCYTKMPFGLKNAGATYQRLVPIQVSRQVTPLVQNTQEVYEEGRLRWTTEAGRRFHELKQHIAALPCLVHPDQERS